MDFLFEQSSHNTFLQLWLHKEIMIKRLHRSKRLVSYDTSMEKCPKWVKSSGASSNPVINLRDLESLAAFLETLM